jgi:hypothetical protein
MLRFFLSVQNEGYHHLKSLFQGPWDEGDEAWGLGMYADACASYLRAARSVQAAKGWEKRHAATVAAVDMVFSSLQTSHLPVSVRSAIDKAAADWLRGLADE